MKKIILLFLLLPFIVTAQRQHLNFDNDWKFSFGHAANPEKDLNYSIANIFSKTGVAPGTAIEAKYDDKKWKTIDLPHDWVVELPFAYKNNFDVMAHGYKP